MKITIEAAAAELAEFLAKVDCKMPKEPVSNELIERFKAALSDCNPTIIRTDKPLVEQLEKQI